MHRIYFIQALAFLLSTACVSTSSSVRLADRISPEQQAALLSADVILVGEQHDNPHHHALQREVLDLLGQKSQLGDIIFEQVNWDQQTIVDNLNNRTLGTLSKDLAWEKSGWPAFTYYEPLFTAAVRFRAKVIAGNIAPQKSKAIYQDGYTAIFTSDEQKQLGLDQELDPASREAMEKEIFDGHCQMVPQDHVKAMVPVQRTRDAAMALAWKRLHKQGKSVFIVGAGHARKDFGIPWYLEKLSPGVKIYSIGMNETAAEAKAELYDQLITTTPAEREDPCKGLQEKFSKPQS